MLIVDFYQMNLQQYLINRRSRMESAPVRRILCTQCLQPQITCYCHQLKPFDPQIDFVILIHPLEVRRRIATGRMAHLCLKNSHLIHGHDFTKNEMVNDLLRDESRQSVILYPGRDSVNLTTNSSKTQEFTIAKGKRLTIFVIDGTWMTAKKMMKHSKNLAVLPQICFTPQKLSQFHVRKQPHPNCYSTIEAVHHIIELLGPRLGLAAENRHHDSLLSVFSFMVEQQLEFVRKSRQTRGPSRYRRARDLAASP